MKEKLSFVAPDIQPLNVDTKQLKINELQKLQQLSEQAEQLDKLRFKNDALGGPLGYYANDPPSSINEKKQLLFLLRRCLSQGELIEVKQGQLLFSLPFFVYRMPDQIELILTKKNFLSLSGNNQILFSLSENPQKVAITLSAPEQTKVMMRKNFQEQAQKLRKTIGQQAEQILKNSDLTAWKTWEKELLSNKEQLPLVFFQAHEIYKDFQEKYCLFLQAENTLTENLVFRRALAKELEPYLIKSKETVLKDFEHLPLPRQYRSLLIKYRDYSYLQFMQEIEEDSWDAINMDKQRAAFHRFLEKYAFSFLFGRQALEVKNDLYFASLDIGGFKNFKFTDKINGYLSAKFLGVTFGTGGGSSVSHESYWAAEDPSDTYESFVKEGNSLEDDQVLADELHDLLIKKYPQIRIINDLGVSRSFHSAFCVTDFYISTESISQEALSQGKEAEDVSGAIMQDIKIFLENLK